MLRSFERFVVFDGCDDRKTVFRSFAKDEFPETLEKIKYKTVSNSMKLHHHGIS